KFTMYVPVERQALEHCRAMRIDELDQPQRVTIGADQDMQSVVERDAVDFDSPRASPGNRPGFEHADWNIARRKLDRRRHAGPAAADDGNISRGASYVVTHVFQAIQSLRIGVSEVRCVSTWQPSARISSSSVR